MTPTRNSVLLYATHKEILPEFPSLVDQLNQPNRQFTQPYNLPDVIQPALPVTEDQVDASLDNLVEKHRGWVAENDLNVNTAPNASLFIVADEDTIPTGTVQVVYIGSEVAGNEKGYDVLRSPISTAVQIFTMIDGGQQGWNEFVFEAQSNGGIIPSCGTDAAVAAPQASASSGEGSQKQLPTKPRT
ncbi:hypothetical protein K435DRAFT_775352 [Dendrothele bispora CBS 962.96]|uniref:Uncharacterized protein n=1 Tax=Dendrothele bispora (strain CBS 962.96) TaxID=1314807 RepID=A0A4S8MIX3_DENBC|nr:hypothetical protein K435DRAFT_775352 [Dendrothele bispora CBS 962.96]